MASGDCCLPPRVADEILRRYADVLRVGKLRLNGDLVTWNTNTSTEHQLIGFCESFIKKLREVAPGLQRSDPGAIRFAAYWYCKAVSINYALIEVILLVRELAGCLCTIETRDDREGQLVHYLVDVEDGGVMRVSLTWNKRNNIIFCNPDKGTKQIKGTMTCLGTEFCLPPAQDFTPVYQMQMRVALPFLSIVRSTIKCGRHKSFYSIIIQEPLRSDHPIETFEEMNAHQKDERALARSESKKRRATGGKDKKAKKDKALRQDADSHISNEVDLFGSVVDQESDLMVAKQSKSSRPDAIVASEACPPDLAIVLEQQATGEVESGAFEQGAKDLQEAGRLRVRVLHAHGILIPTASPTLCVGGGGHSPSRSSGDYVCSSHSPKGNDSIGSYDLEASVGDDASEEVSYHAICSVGLATAVTSAGVPLGDCIHWDNEDLWFAVAVADLRREVHVRLVRRRGGTEHLLALASQPISAALISDGGPGMYATVRLLVDSDAVVSACPPFAYDTTHACGTALDAGGGDVMDSPHLKLELQLLANATSEVAKKGSPKPPSTSQSPQATPLRSRRDVKVSPSRPGAGADEGEDADPKVDLPSAAALVGAVPRRKSERGAGSGHHSDSTPLRATAAVPAVKVRAVSEQLRGGARGFCTCE